MSVNFTDRFTTFKVQINNRFAADGI